MPGTGSFPGYKVACRYGCKDKDGRRKTCKDPNLLRKHHGRIHNVWSDRERNMDTFKRCRNCKKGFDGSDVYEKHIAKIPEKCKNADGKWKPHPVTDQEIADTYAFADDVRRISEHLKEYVDERGGRAYMDPSGWVQEHQGQAGGPASGSGQGTSSRGAEYSDSDPASQGEVLDAPAIGDAALGAGLGEQVARATEAGEFPDLYDWLFSPDWQQHPGRTGEVGQQDLPRPVMPDSEGMEMLSEATGPRHFAVYQQIGDSRFALPSEPQTQQQFVSQDPQGAQGLPILQQDSGWWDGPDAWPQVQGYGVAGTQQAAVTPGYPHAPIGNFTFRLDPDPELILSEYDGAGMPPGGQEQGQLLDFELDNSAFLPLVPEPQAPGHAAVGMHQGVQGLGNPPTSQQNGGEFLCLTPQPYVSGGFGFGMQQVAQDTQDLLAPQQNGASLPAPLHHEQMQGDPFAGLQQSVQPHRRAQHPKHRQELVQDEEPAQKRQRAGPTGISQRGHRQQRLQGMRSFDQLADPLAVLDLSSGPGTMHQGAQIYGQQGDIRSTETFVSTGPSFAAARRESAARSGSTQQVAEPYGQQQPHPHPGSMGIAPSDPSSRRKRQAQTAQGTQQHARGYGQQQVPRLGQGFEQRARAAPVPSGVPNMAMEQLNAQESWREQQQQQGQHDRQPPLTFVPPMSPAPMMPVYTAQGTMQQADWTTFWHQTQAQQSQRQHLQQRTVPVQQLQHGTRSLDHQSCGTLQSSHSFGTESFGTIPETMQTGWPARSDGLEFPTTLPQNWSYG